MSYCRVVVTNKCNLNCCFCYMKDDDIRESFILTDPSDIAKMDYDEVKITGGEPLLYPERVTDFVQLVKKHKPHGRITLYTNGILLDSNMACEMVDAGISEINVSLHDTGKGHNWRNLQLINNYIVPLRFLVSDTEVSEFIRKFAKVQGIPLRIWKLDDCKDMEPEDRYSIDWD